MLRIIPANVNALKLKNQGKMGAFLNLATCKPRALFTGAEKHRWKSGWQNADEKCTRRKCGRTRVVARLLASWIRGIIPSNVYTVHFYDPFIFFFFFHRQTKSALFSPWKTKHLVMSRSINTFSFFFPIKNFFQLFPIFIFLIFFPQQIKLIRFDNSFFLSWNWHRVNS